MDANGQEIATIVDKKTMVDAAKLLSVNLNMLIVALMMRIMAVRGEHIHSNLVPDKAVDARNALAKTVYSAVLLWVVSKVNNCIKW